MAEVAVAVVVGAGVIALLVKLVRDDRSGALDNPGPMKGLGKSGEPRDDPARRGR